ncbi:MAG: hypothetical protein V3571_07410 [Pseudodesulfovibrio sp.]
MTRSAWLFWLILVLACLTPLVHARTANFHFLAGARTDGSAAPEAIGAHWPHSRPDTNATGAHDAAPKE